MELEFLIPQGSSVPLLSFPIVMCHGGAFSLGSLCLCLSSRLNGVLLSFVVEALFVQVPFRGNYSMSSCRLSCLWEEVSSGSTILNPTPYCFLVYQILNIMCCIPAVKG